MSKRQQELLSARKCPPIKSSEVDVGTRWRGVDGNMYEAVVNAAGVRRWKVVGGPAPTTAIASSKPKPKLAVTTPFSGTMTSTRNARGATAYASNTTAPPASMLPKPRTRAVTKPKPAPQPKSILRGRLTVTSKAVAFDPNLEDEGEEEEEEETYGGQTPMELEENGNKATPRSKRITGSTPMRHESGYPVFTLTQLRDAARRAGIRGFSRMNRNELEQVLGGV